ncbi:hypothetical protein RND71_039179 [Anisodus tanguticus]|uniref:N-acetyltransferase domain-containing protein n=1 Tax=Anisodus tanguticus TaxID=243964 RepID=A0AAE1QW60_9SOLA|nr:hypothetical protein RND71_039179 [Anisodus tanguticus]
MDEEIIDNITLRPIEISDIDDFMVWPTDDNSEARVCSCSHFWGKGIVTRVVKLVTSAVFSEFPYLERLEVLVDVDNQGSQRVLEKACFFKEGILRKYMVLKGKSRDIVIFSFLATDSL